MTICEWLRFLWTSLVQYYCSKRSGVIISIVLLVLSDSITRTMISSIRCNSVTVANSHVLCEAHCYLFSSEPPLTPERRSSLCGCPSRGSPWFKSGRRRPCHPGCRNGYLGHCERKMVSCDADHIAPRGPSGQGKYRPLKSHSEVFLQYDKAAFHLPNINI